MSKSPSVREDQVFSRVDEAPEAPVTPDGTITISGLEIVLSGTSKTTMGVGNQNVTCDTEQVATSGASITTSAVGKHTISGGLIMIN